MTSTPAMMTTTPGSGVTSAVETTGGSSPSAARPRPRRKRHRGRGIALVPAHVLAWTYAALLILPLYYLLTSAFKSNREILEAPFALPASFSFDNFTQAWDRVSLGMALGNSLLITSAAALVTLVLAVPAAYGLARARGRVGIVMERIFALGFLIPGFAALVPTVLLAIGLNLYHTRAFLILFMPSTALPLSVILLAQFMRAIPPELEESAAVDGAHRMRILWSIYLPLAMPGVATVTILNVLNFWNEYMFTLILGGSDPSVRTAQVALPNLISQTNTEYGILAAGTLITLLPVYLAYTLASRQMENALLQGALKT